MAERTKATVLKTVSGATRSWVRIPLLPPRASVSRPFRAVGMGACANAGRSSPPSFDQLRAYWREYQEEMLGFVDTIGDHRLAERITIPWVKDPPLSITVTEALTQCAMHSQ